MSRHAENGIIKTHRIRQAIEFGAGLTAGYFLGRKLAIELRRHIKSRSVENYVTATHRIKTRLPEGIRTIDNVHERADLKIEDLKDQANFKEGATSPKLVQFTSKATEADIASVIKNPENKSFVARGKRSSLTGASVPTNAFVPEGDVVLDMSQMQRIGELIETPDGEKFITVQPGVTFKKLEEEVLNPLGLFIPSAPTYKDATIAGAASTNAGGARSEKYGKMYEYIQSLDLMLESGEVLHIEKGGNISHPPDKEHPYPYFELETVNREIRIIPVPTYKMPDVDKISAGYNNKVQPGEPGVDLLRLIVGAEGTLGVITKITLKVIEEPPTAMLLIPCVDDTQILELNSSLREIEPEKRITRVPGGISAVELMGESAVDLIRNKFKTQFRKLNIPEDAGALVLVQVEMPDESEQSLEKVFDLCKSEKFQIPTESIVGAYPKDHDIKEDILAVREEIPATVNSIVENLGSAKVGTDACVKPENLANLVQIIKEEYGKAGVKFTWWGHGQGNPHGNALANIDELEDARAAALQIGIRAVRELDGCGTSEHGIGKNKQKKKLLIETYREEGIKMMRDFKRAFDPMGRIAPGNILPLSA